MDLIETAQNFPIIMQIFIFCAGACVGSFLNVCILRIPKGESIVSPPSHCKCGKPIRWFDNLPILSWFLLRGKARCCGGRISFRYPLVEALAAVLFLMLWNAFPPQVAAAHMLFASLMIFCAFVDIDTMHLPDIATIGGTILGAALSAAIPDLHGFGADMHPLARHLGGFLCAAAGAAVSSGVLYWVRLLASALFRREAMGEGDVVLIGCIGAFCGWQGGLFALFGGSVLGCVVMLPIVAAKQIFARGKDAAPPEIPFGPWLALGAVVYIFIAGHANAYIGGFAEIFAK